MKISSQTLNALYLRAVGEIAGLQPNEGPGLVDSRRCYAALGVLQRALSPECCPRMTVERHRSLEGLVAGFWETVERSHGWSPKIPSVDLRAVVENLFRSNFLHGLDLQEEGKIAGFLANVHLDPGRMQTILARGSGSRSVFEPGTLMPVSPTTVVAGGGAAVYPPVSPSEGDEAARLTSLPEMPDREGGHLLVQRVAVDEDGNWRVVKKILSNVRLVKQIGEGGCSDVFLAIQAMGENERRVAVKIVIEGAQEDMRSALKTAFQNETRFSEDLKGLPHVTVVYDVDETYLLRPFIIMELLSGGSLQDWIGRVNGGTIEGGYEKEDFKLETAVNFAIQAVLGVMEIHSKGILHRDIKPDNFMRTADGLTVKLLDLGLAKRRGEWEPSSLVSGTPGFIPAESLKGKTIDYDPEDFTRDVFALGVTLYLLLTGEHPFLKDAGRVLEQFRDKTLEAARTNDIVPPSQVHPERGISRALDRVVMKALAGDPKDRYQSAQELLADLITCRARDFEWEAQGIFKQISEAAKRPGIGPGDIGDLWRNWERSMVGAVEEYRKAHQSHPSRFTAAHLVKALRKLCRSARSMEAYANYAAEIVTLDPGSEEARDVGHPTHVKFLLDRDLPKGASVQFSLARFRNMDGILTFDDFVTDRSLPPDGGELDLPSGFTYGLLAAGNGVKDVFIPLPVWHWDYEIRVPVYEDTADLREYSIMPAGPVAVRTRRGFFAEMPQRSFTTDRDVGLRSLVTNDEYWAFLDRLRERHPLLGWWHVRKRWPANWDRRSRKGAFFDRSGNRLEREAPVEIDSRDDARAYLKEMRPGDRLPTLAEMLQATRGSSDTRKWPWGDAEPDEAETMIAGCRIFGRHSATGVPLPNNLPGILDFSPFTPLIEGVRIVHVQHVALNLPKFVEFPDSLEERRQILKDLKLERLDPADPGLRERVVLYLGGSFRESHPGNPDMPRCDEGRMASRRGKMRAAILPVRPLRSAAPTPSRISS